MAHPEWVEAQKRQGYEIKKIGMGYMTTQMFHNGVR